MDFIKGFKAKGITLPGGPSSVCEKGAPSISDEISALVVPLLGICYGMQLTAKILGGRVERSGKREYGGAELMPADPAGLFAGLGKKPIKVWMSHGDRVEALPIGFKAIGKSSNSEICAMLDEKRRIYGVQFHPEVVHTPGGAKILKNFILRICRCAPVWTMKSFIETDVAEIREKVGADRVVCGISGGVDSAVAGLLVHKAIGSQLTCIFVDNGVQVS